MSHMSELDLFDHVAGKADLTTQASEHLQDRDDCREQAVELRRLIQHSGGVEKARRLLAEQGSGSWPHEFGNPTSKHIKKAKNQRPATEI